PDDNLGVGRALAGALFLAFSLSLVPGMFGGKLGELDSMVPFGASSPLAGCTESNGEKTAWLKNQYYEALAQAKRENKLVFISFTGYACTNCHWMKANMFTRPEVMAEMKRFVLVELYTDGTDKASETNQDLENRLFTTVSIPFYALMDADG